ncbi:MAG: acyltransferase [Actinomycetota bacterium]|nr:acyltransferase [Actinomycetota bacterium]
MSEREVPIVGRPPDLPPNRFNPHAWLIGDPVIGEGTWIGAFTVVDGSGGLTIGRGCDVSSGVHIYTHSTVKRCVSGRAFDQVERSAVSIGDHVFLGAGSIINMGVKIGDGSVVAAGAVVTSDVPARTVVAGVPARAVAKVVVDGGNVSFERLPADPSSGDRVR